MLHLLTFSLRLTHHRHAVLIAAAVASVTCLLVAAVPASGGASRTWLDEVNRYRTAAGLQRAVDEPAWTDGIKAHLRYLALTPDTYFTGDYRNAHSENPASPYYTPDGAHEGESSNLGSGGTDVEAIDGWLTAPFHAIGILRPGLTRIGFARDPKSGAAGLDVINGLSWGASATSPVLFPGPGMTTELTTFPDAELPSPTETCGWHAAGLPLIALLTAPPAPGTAATLDGPDRSASSAAGSVCVVTARTFRTTDDVYGPTGRDILDGDNAVLVIPKTPLRKGTYTATITQPGLADITWSFSVAPASADVPQSRCVVPNVRGMTQNAALRLMDAKRCSVDGDRLQHSTTVPRNRVIGSIPRAGARVAYGKSVTLVVSSGR